MMRRLFPAPLLSLALVALWLVLTNPYSLGNWLMAVVLAIAVPLFTQSLRPTPVRFSHPWVAFKLFLQVGKDVIGSNFRVLYGTLSRGDRMAQGGFVVVPLDLRDPNGLAVLAAIMCVIPGTVWSELALDGSELLVHVFDLKDPELDIAMIKTRYERPLMEIFE